MFKVLVAFSILIFAGFANAKSAVDCGLRKSDLEALSRLGHEAKDAVELAELGTDRFPYKYYSKNKRVQSFIQHLKGSAYRKGQTMATSDGTCLSAVLESADGRLLQRWWSTPGKSDYYAKGSVPRLEERHFKNIMGPGMLRPEDAPEGAILVYDGGNCKFIAEGCGHIEVKTNIKGCEFLSNYCSNIPVQSAGNRPFKLKAIMIIPPEKYF